MNNTVGKFVRVGLIATLIALLVSIFLFGFLAVVNTLFNITRVAVNLYHIVNYFNAQVEVSFFNVLVDSLLANSDVIAQGIILSLIFIPVVFISILAFVFIILQARKTSKIQKLTLKVDNLPNNCKLDLKETKKPKQGLIVKIILSSLLLILVFVCAFGKDALEAVMLFRKVDVLLSIVDLVRLLLNTRLSLLLFANIAITLLYLTTMILLPKLLGIIFILIQCASVLGILALFFGGRTQEVDELEDTIKQKSRFAKIREMEENDEVDELSQLF